MSKESQYKQQMQELGTYLPAYDEEIHMLAVMERELSRAMKAWKATAPDGKAPSVLNEHYGIIQSLRKDILSHRESLGLTPKGLQRLKRGIVSESDTGGDGIGKKLDDLMAQVSGYDRVDCL